LQVLAEQTISVFITTTLLGAMRVGEENSDTQILGQSLVVSHFRAPIIREGFGADQAAPFSAHRGIPSTLILHRSPPLLPKPLTGLYAPPAFPLLSG